MGVLQIARGWISAADLPDVSKCFRRIRSKHPCQRPPCYFAWGCFRYFSWKREPRRPLRLSFPLMIAAWLAKPCLLRRQVSRFADGSDAKPDQIEGAGQLEQGEELRAGKYDRRDAEAARDNVHKATQCGAEGGGDAGLAAPRQRSCRHVENAGPGNCGNDHRGQQEQREVSAAHR